MKIAVFLFMVVILFQFPVWAQQHELEASISCEEVAIPCLPAVQRELTIIRSTTELRRLFPGGADCASPSIDFSRVFVICVRPRMLNGCREPEVKTVLSWKKGENLHVQMKIREFGRCFQLWPDAFWIKIPLTYYTPTVDFQISKSIQSIPED